MLAIVLTVPSSEAELAADALWGLGVLAVEERPAGEAMVELWTSLGDDPSDVVHGLEALPARWRWRMVEIDDAVAEAWREHAVPSWITSDLVVVPAWVERPRTAPIDVPGPTDAPGGPPRITELRIDPGAAFGLGDHPTTVLTLRALSRLLWRDATVLDVGCGSGVLAVGAAVLGASYVEAIDISPAAVSATVANAERNGVSGRIVASTTRLADVEGSFDVVCANILAPALVELAPDLARVTAPAGVLVVSGILDDVHGHVLDALAPMRVVERSSREGWAAVVLRH